MEVFEVVRTVLAVRSYQDKPVPPDGVGSNWVGFLGMTEVKSLLGIPDDLDVLAILPFGYPVQARRRGKKKREPLSEVAQRGRFGQPFKDAAWFSGRLHKPKGPVPGPTPSAYFAGAQRCLRFRLNDGVDHLDDPVAG